MIGAPELKKWFMLDPDYAPFRDTSIGCDQSLTPAIITRNEWRSSNWWWWGDPSSLSSPTFVPSLPSLHLNPARRSA